MTEKARCLCWVPKSVYGVQRNQAWKAKRCKGGGGNGADVSSSFWKRPLVPYGCMTERRLSYPCPWTIPVRKPSQTTHPGRKEIKT